MTPRTGCRCMCAGKPGCWEALGFGLDLSANAPPPAPRTIWSMSRPKRGGRCRAMPRASMPAGCSSCRQIPAGSKGRRGGCARKWPPGLALTGHFLLERVLRPAWQGNAAGQDQAGRDCRTPSPAEERVRWRYANQNKRPVMVALPDEIRSENLSKALAERYLAYALSTITQRALARCARRAEAGPSPHPVRHAAAAAGPGFAPFKKSAKVVGDVMGSFPSPWRPGDL